MKTRPRLFVSVPDDRHLDARRQGIKRAILQFITAHGFDPVGFEPDQFGTGLPMHMESWTVDRAKELIRRCDGVLVLALARAQAQFTSMGPQFGPPPAGPQPIPTAYNHLEGALGVSRGLPVLILHEEFMERTGIFASGITSSAIPAQADHAWVLSPQFQNHFIAWSQLVHRRRDVFLGYCSKADKVAEEIRDFMEAAEFTVVDWARDFESAGATVLEEIERAADRCRCAVFVFSKDDELIPNATGKPGFEAVPRDNVLLEAGYFTRSHGKSRVAIIRETGAKMPADLGGIIYLSYKEGDQLADAKAGLLKFLHRALRENPVQPIA